MRKIRITETYESPQFGKGSIREESGLINTFDNMYKYNVDDELQDAHSRNVNTNKIFNKRNSMFSFMGSENESQTSESAQEIRSKKSGSFSNESKITPKFNSFKHDLISRKNSSSTPFRNHLALKAEQVKFHKGMLSDSIIYGSVSNIFVFISFINTFKSKNIHQVFT